MSLNYDFVYSYLFTVWKILSATSTQNFCLIRCKRNINTLFATTTTTAAFVCLTRVTQGYSGAAVSEPDWALSLTIVSFWHVECISVDALVY